MEGPLLVLKSWLLTAALIWIYQRCFQKVAPPSPGFEAFCRTEPVVGAVLGVSGVEAHVGALLVERLGRRSAAVATLGGFPWPHYRLSLAVEGVSGAVLLRVKGARVVRTADRQLPALASVLRDVLNELPDEAEVWLHRGAYDNGLNAPPESGWSIARGSRARPQLTARSEAPLEVCAAPSAANSAAGEVEGPRMISDYLALENQRPFLLP